MKYNRLRSVLLIICCLVTLGSSIPVHALSDEDYNALAGGWANWTTQQFICAASGNTTLSGSGPIEQIYNYFTQTKGLQPFQAAGFMGNIQAESGFNPKALEPGTTGDAPIPGRGYGLVQWTFPARQDPLIAAAAAKNLPVYDLSVQLDYIWYEITDGPAPYGGQLAQLKATTDVASATRFIEDHYEVHAGGPQPVRIDNATAILAKYGSGAPSGSNATTSSCGTSGPDNPSADGYSLPVAQKWFDSNPEWFSKPHHDYPSADIPVPTGTEVYSMTSGTVIKAPIVDTNCQGCKSGSYGRGVEIDAGNGVKIIYGHGLDGGTISGAKVGDTVHPGQLIMHSDTTGNSTGPHLHFEIDFNGTQMCPQNLLMAIGQHKPLPSIASLPTAGCTN